MHIKKGSLLLDLMIAVTIFFFAASITIHIGSSAQKTQCMLELVLLKQTIQTTQLEAMITAQDLIIYIDIAKNQYRSPRMMTELKTLCIPTKQIDIPFAGNHSSSCTFAQNKIVCFKTGIISGGTVYFQAKDDKSLFFCLSCPVSQSNNISLYHYKNGWAICT